MPLDLSGLSINATFAEDFYGFCKKSKKHFYADRGYPETRHPIVHKNLKNTEGWRVINEKRSLGITIGLDEVHLTNIQELHDLLFGFGEILMEPRADFSRVVAVSFAMKNFQLGNSCHEFNLHPSYKMKPESFFSYKMLSGQLQVAYFNEDGVQFLAGMCYYPRLARKVDLGFTESDQMKLEYLKAEPFPLRDRTSHPFFADGYYGRYCTSSRKRVLVWTRKDDGQIVHRDYEWLEQKFTLHGCPECAEDFRNNEKKKQEDILNSAVAISAAKAKLDAEAQAHQKEVNKKANPKSTPKPKDSDLDDFDTMDDIIRIEYGN